MTLSKRLVPVLLITLCCLGLRTLNAQEASAAESRPGPLGGGGKPVTLLGHAIQVGEKAPDFTAYDSSMQAVSLHDYAGKVVIITVFPSIDTKVCATQTRSFNKQASAIPEVQILSVSVDLPFALGRFCAAEGIDRVRTLSDYRHTEFGLKYGYLIDEIRLLARGTVIVDKQGLVRYVEMVPQLGQEPDYATAIGMASKLAGS